jgi:hypothetical protein
MWGVLLAGKFAAARDIYVDNRIGDDRQNGRNPEIVVGSGGPVRTMAKALRLATGGDRIVLAASEIPYREMLSFTSSKHSGAFGRPFIVEGNGAILDGSNLIPPEGWRWVGGDVFAFRPAGLGYQQFFVNGRAAVRRPSKPADRQPPELGVLEWCLSGGEIRFRVEPGRPPAEYQLACCGLRTAITLYHVRHIVIRNLTLQAFQFDGIAASDAASGVLLQGITARYNGRSGVSVAGASQVELEQCRLFGNGESQLHNESFARTFLRATELVADTAPAVFSKGGSIQQLPALD